MIEANEQADSRFFPGYIWVSEQADCRLGLCMPAATERAGAEMMVPKRYWNCGHTIALFTKTAPYDVPQRHIFNY